MVIFFYFVSYSDSMMEKIKTLLSIIIIVICLPYLVTFVVQGDILHEKMQEDTDKSSEDEDTGHLVLILANEMPVTYEKEALKAQSVIVRTNLLYAREHDEPEPDAISSEDMRKQLGAEDYQKRYELMKSCVEETAGEVITYHKNVVQLPYHFVSAGKTRDASEIEQEEKFPYLKSVSSVPDLRSEQFLKIEFFSAKQFFNKIKSAYPELEMDDDKMNQFDKMVKITKRDNAAYVLETELAGKKITGDDFRTIFSLHSTCFSIKEVDGKVRIVTKGYGQGYGMSQYGANEMAKEGSTYEDILKHYYHGIKIQKQKDK